MGEAKRKRTIGHLNTAQSLPRVMHAICFKAPHRLAGQVVRRGHHAHVFFDYNEARLVLGQLIRDGRLTEEVAEVVRLWVDRHTGQQQVSAAPEAKADA